MAKYQVIVGNIGTVYDGDSRVKAGAEFANYKIDSIRFIGRAAGEDIILMMDGEPLEEYIGSRSTVAIDVPRPMDREKMIKFLIGLHGSIEAHHATNLCNSQYLYQKNPELLRVIQYLRKEEG
jgi:hypothetical protein